MSLRRSEASPSAPTSRAAQRTATRERIVEAALEAFAEKGFRGASTRDIAQRAGTNQGLITYHFRSKEDLWRAAADWIFALLEKTLGERLGSLDLSDARERARAGVRAYVRFAAEHPELFRLMVDAGNDEDARTRWLVDTHLKPRFAQLWSVLRRGADVPEAELPHFWYAMAGAGSLMFAVAPECRRLTGFDPERREAIDAHADFVARLLVP